MDNKEIVESEIKLVFEFTDEWGYHTHIAKEFTYNNDINQLDSLLCEIKLCLLACGFDPESVDEAITCE